MWTREAASLECYDNFTMKSLALVLLLLALPLEAADTGRLMRQIERGSGAERTAALRDLAKEDAPAAAAKAIEWLEPNVDPALRRAAARTLWDLGDKAKSAEPALRARLDDRDDDVAYAAVGALSTMGVPKSELRPARLRLARSNDGFIAFYASRALFPDPELTLDAVIDAALAGVNLVAGGRPSDLKTRDTLRTNTRLLLENVAKQSGRAGFDGTAYAPTRARPRRARRQLPRRSATFRHSTATRCRSAHCSTRRSRGCGAVRCLPSSTIRTRRRRSSTR